MGDMHGELTEASDWSTRLGEMEQWYRDLLDEGDEVARAALAADYDPHAAFFGSLKGRILDVGGGVGLTARYLSDACEYWVIDPAGVWGQSDWKSFGDEFAGEGPAPRFLEGTGEALPFGECEFDAVLALWSLNHAEDPAKCVREMTRVLRPGGAMLLVLEDMVPTWKDVAARTVQAVRRRLGVPARRVDWKQLGVNTLKDSVFHKLWKREWPLQDDHVRFDEAIIDSEDELRLCRREWIGGYLTIECRKE